MTRKAKHQIFATDFKFKFIRKAYTKLIFQGKLSKPILKKINIINLLISKTNFITNKYFLLEIS